MTTNDDINWEKNEPIIRKYGIQTWRNGKRTPEHLVSVTHTGVSLNSMLNEARADTIKKHIGIIWDWWATKPQVRKNDATIRIITRTDIEELVRLME